MARTFALIGVDAEPVHVEVDIGSGLPSFTIVGLPGGAVRESRERVRSALTNSGFKYPQHRITANLAPADLRKAGPGFDLAIAAALRGRRAGPDAAWGSRGGSWARQGTRPSGCSIATRWPASWPWTGRSVP